ncbi:MAG TPA: DNA-binding response regulator, partial [Clostridium sp.]|nr:DNA-binding response regulator [Clostridium sp.]
NTTDFKVYEIAEKVGFRDSHYFGICFKKHVGVTVKEYKQR